MTRLGLVGCGRWGKNLLRVFETRADVAMVCTRSHGESADWLARHYPQVRHTRRYDDLLGDERIDAVVIATPIDTHAVIAQRALEAGKHAFVEKPLANRSVEARVLAELATERRLVLFVGHIFVYHPVLAQLSTVAAEDPVVFCKMTWDKFGSFSESLLWNVVLHEISVAHELFGERPRRMAILRREGTVTSLDSLWLSLSFSGDRECQIHVNRCVERKRKVTCVRTRSGSLWVWENDRLLRVEPASATGNEWSCNGELVGQQELVFRSKAEPLALEAEAFLDCVTSGTRPRTDGHYATVIVEVLEELETLCR